MAIHTVSLCSGVGGLDTGFKLAVPDARTVCYVECEAFACAILEKEMRNGGLDEAPIWSNVKTFNGRPWRGKVDCIIGGYPCQPFSVAGKKKGAEDPRHLWPDIKKIIEEVNPALCFFENVGGHLRIGFEQVANDLQRLGYKVKAGLFTASEVGAPHKRERLFILGYTDRFNLQRCKNSKHNNSRPNQFDSTSGNTMDNVGYTEHHGLFAPTKQGSHGKNDGSRGTEGRKEQTWKSQGTNYFPPGPFSPNWEGIKPDLKPAIFRMDDGLENWANRVRACGNGVIPLQAAYAFNILYGK